MESIQRKQFNRYIENFDFHRLFNQLGWNFVDDKFPKKAAEKIFQFHHIAEKSGFAILECLPDSEGNIPEAQIRKRIHTEIAKLHHEHLIIFVDKNKTVQQWELLVREPNKPIRTVSHKWILGQAPELLYQKLSGAFFSIEEDELGTLTIVDVVQRVKENFGANAEKVTKKFYTDFKKQHTAFLEFIKGIDDNIPHKENSNKQWYASLMLNRLMFCYFIQKKGFLDQDKEYLMNKLRTCQKLSGNDKFYSFYRSFLLELFHDGLGRPVNRRSEDLPIALGNIPYLNGGLFDVHELEQQFETIQIDDAAFERIFEFFDKWEWHLDTREHTEGRTINPDVIGYIFEKYINDRASMGAYYTKEDITDYIGKNTILPFLFDETERHFKSGFTTDGELWSALKDSGDTYIYDAVKHGIPGDSELFNDLLDEVKGGFFPDFEQQIVRESTSPHLWEIRGAWNQKTPPEIGLPTEIYRELIERRKRYAELKRKIEAGDIFHVNDFITYNLNIRQFIQDHLEHTQDPEFIRHFYKALNKITILDPTCGSGAFLFAAMNILEPLYEACINRMEEFTEEQPGKHVFFEETLKLVKSEEHPNLKYFIYKRIILNNLFGVDIMKEAVEIAKLRLFLKLVATVDVDPTKENYGLEPLPDIDFNIRAGNTLVGFATEKELLETIEKKEALFAHDKLDEFKEDFNLVSQAFRRFQNNQLINDQGSDSFRSAKVELNSRLKDLNHKLNAYLVTNYGIDAQQSPVKYQKWLTSHQPFHWFAEFYQIVGAHGGFDVIIGNPPYLEFKQVHYNLDTYHSSDTKAVHAVCIERSITLKHLRGNCGMIVPLSLVSTQRMKVVQSIIEDESYTAYSNFSWRPAKLFDTVNRALTIFISNSNDGGSMCLTNDYTKWTADNRESLLDTLHFQHVSTSRSEVWVPKIAQNIEVSILRKIKLKSGFLGNFLRNRGKPLYYRSDGGLYWKVFTPNSPKFIVQGKTGVSTREKKILFEGSRIVTSAIGLLSSSTFWWWYTVTSNCRHLNPFDLKFFPTDEPVLNDSELFRLGNEYIKDIERNSSMLTRIQKQTGVIQTQSFKILKSKSIIDQIDLVLSQHYGFTEEELDFIINYDVKYRMGKDLNKGLD